MVCVRLPTNLMSSVVRMTSHCILCRIIMGQGAFVGSVSAGTLPVYNAYVTDKITNTVATLVVN